ncbi:MAG TPA: glycolate oxidase subunit GlcE [Methylophilaceae bacterium]|nr:glycolate oxidase subunit GlcE [Methylophilaceae bacterium]
MNIYDQWLADCSERIRQAVAEQRKLSIRGSGSKGFYGNAVTADVLELAEYAGVVDYQPRELTLTARAGTRLDVIEALLAKNNQMLPFEPPHFGPDATLGGCVSTGLSGPRRPYAGAVRDAVLGTKVMDGRAQVLRFGGQVIKNVAGYDVSRLMVGSMGTLGVLLEVSIKVLPCPDSECTLMLEMPADKAVDTMNRWAASPLPLSATVWRAGHLYVRLSGTESAVQAAMPKIGGEQIPDGQAFWMALREQTMPDLAMRPLWRLSVPTTATVLTAPGQPVIEWGGGVRWYGTDMSVDTLRALAKQAGGHATLFRSNQPVRQAFSPLTPPLAALHQRIRLALDPHGVFDTGRL